MWKSLAQNSITLWFTSPEIYWSVFVLYYIVRFFIIEINIDKQHLFIFLLDLRSEPLLFWDTVATEIESA